MMTTAKEAYLHKFDRVAQEGRAHFQLNGDNLIVEELRDEEFKTSSGIILAKGPSSVLGLEADRPTFARVLLVGEGYYDDVTKDSVPLDVKPGDIILVGKHSLKRFSVFGKLMSYGETTLALTRAEEIQMRFHGQEGFDAFFGVLNRAAETQMEAGA